MGPPEVTPTEAPSQNTTSQEPFWMSRVFWTIHIFMLYVMIMIFSGKIQGEPGLLQMVAVVSAYTGFRFGKQVQP